MVTPKAYVSMCVDRYGISHDTALSLLDLSAKYPHWSIHLVSESLLERARNISTEHFYNNKDAGDVILYIDSDIVFTVDDACRLVERALELDSIVGGIYVSRWDKSPSITIRTKQREKLDIGSDQLVEVDAVSTGFMAVPRTTLNKLVDAGLAEYLELNKYHRWFEVTTTKDDQSKTFLLSEDWALCYKAAALGYKIYVDCKPELGHVGQKIYTIRDLVTK